jgi:hypothetical protein
MSDELIIVENYFEEVLIKLMDEKEMCKPHQ